MLKKYKFLMIIYVAALCTLFIYDKQLFSNIKMDLNYVSCGSATGIPAPVPKITTIGYTILTVGTPLVLIVFSIVTLVKAILSASADEISKARGKLIKKIIISILVFVTAALVQFAINRFATNSKDKNSISKCLKCFLYYNSTDCPESSTGNEIYKGTNKRTNDNSSIGTESDSNSNKKSNKNSKNRASVEHSIIVGDSRVDGVCQFTDSYHNVSAKCRDMWGVALGGSGNKWFTEEAIPLINAKLSDHTKYNIVFFMGLGNLGYLEEGQAEITAERYMVPMKDAINNGTWGKHHVIVVSLTDLGADRVSTGGHYERAAIKEFNKVMKQKVEAANLDNMEYCDISDLAVGDKTVDNIHYTTEGYNMVYNEIVNKCIK